MKIFVTGASGFVGSKLVPELVRRGHEVTAVWKKNKPLYNNVRIIQGDLLSAKLLDDAIAGQDVVIHLAAVMLTKSSQKKELQDLAHAGTENLVRSSERAGVKKFIYISSTVAIGATRAGSSLVSEKSESEISGWGSFLNVSAKRQSENIITKSSLNWVVLYPGLLYGAGDWKKEIRKANKPILKGKMPFYFSGGVNINSVESFVDGIILALDKGQPSSRYVLGGENITNYAFFKLLAESNNKKAPNLKFPDSILRFFGNLNLGLNKESVEMLLSYHWSDSSKAIRELGYRPGKAADAINNSTKWILDNGGI